MRTILVVEDDPGMRYFLGQILQGSGYRILEAADGAGALELLKDPANAVDLLLADINLKGSLELSDAVRRDNPATKALFVSPDGRPEFNLLRKPFTPTDMLLEIERILAKDKAAGG